MVLFIEESWWKTKSMDKEQDHLEKILLEVLNIHVPMKAE